LLGGAFPPQLRRLAIARQWEPLCSDHISELAALQRLRTLELGDVSAADLAPLLQIPQLTRLRTAQGLLPHPCAAVRQMGALPALRPHVAS